MGNNASYFNKNADKDIKGNDEIALDDSIILNDSKIFKIYNMKNLNNTQLMKIQKLYELLNQYGKPFPSENFNSKNWVNFYTNTDPFFRINNTDTEIVHNNLKIYNPNNLNRIRIYQGDLNKNGERHGFGKYTTPLYDLIGMWKNDKFNGWGRIIRHNGQIYEGKFVNGIINGKGIFIDKNKNKYVGDFVNMKKCGEGKWITKNMVYEGEFHNNKIDGKGKIKFFNSGIEYIGTFKNEQIDGYGIFKWVNGDEYEGEVKNGKMHGKGTYKYNNGKTYNGIFFNGKIVDEKEASKIHKDIKIKKTNSLFIKKHSYSNYNYNTFDSTNKNLKELNTFTNKNRRKISRSNFKSFDIDVNSSYMNKNLYENKELDQIQECPGYLDNYYDYDYEPDILYDFHFNKEVFQYNNNNFDLDTYLEYNNNGESNNNNNEMKIVDSDNNYNNNKKDIKISDY